MSEPRLWISAFGIHTGGGLVLMRALAQAAAPWLKGLNLDARAELGPWPAALQVRRVRRSLLDRLCAQWEIGRKAQDGDVLLCFNSLPPLRPSRAKVLAFVHAPHFVGLHQGIAYTPLTRWRIRIERLWFRCGIRHVDECWVQTPAMAAALRQQHPGLTVREMPLVDETLRQLQGDGVQQAPKAEGGFFYPADAVGHKNHLNLLRAWQLLDRQGLRPLLRLTLTDAEWQALWQALGADPASLAHVRNGGRMTRAAVLETMRDSQALMFASQAETFGLPMLEAQALGLPILAAERDFVRDVCSPVQTFDPASPVSIARAVERFLGAARPGLACIGAERFIEQLLQ